MNKKKIIVFMPSIEIGVVEKNFFLITNYLSKKLNEITVVTSSDTIKFNLNKKIKIISTNLTLVKFIGRRLKFLICLLLLVKEILNSKNPTVFCFQGIAYCTILCKIFSIKIIIRSNSSPSGWSKNFIKKFFYKKIYGMADKIIVNSLAFKKEIKNKLNLDSVCIYNPLDKKRILINSKKKINFKFFKNNSINIISVARFADQKDHECLIRAINFLKNNHIRLVLLGSGPTKNKIFKFIKELKLEKIIKIVNAKKNPYPYIKMSGLFILSSKFEGLPNCLLEAIVLKKLVISSNCPTGPYEILDKGKGGFLFPVGDHRLLAKQIKKFIESKSKFKTKTSYAYKRLDRFNFEYRLKT